MATESQDGEGGSRLVNRYSKKEWGSTQGRYGDSSVTYVGVTPNKEYHLDFYGYLEIDGSGGSSATFYYSTEINNHSVNIEDY